MLNVETSENTDTTESTAAEMEAKSRGRAHKVFLADAKSGSTLNPLKPNLVRTIFKNSFRASKKTPHFAITKINSLMQFKEIIAITLRNIRHS
jgi:hypothetical protein